MDEKGLDAGDSGTGDGWVEAAVAGFSQSPYFCLVVEGPDLIVRAANQLVLQLAGDRGLGLPLREAYAELTGQQAVEVYEKCYQTGEVQQFSEWRIQLEGPDNTTTEIYLDFVGRPWLDDDGTVRGVVGTAQDVTEKAMSRQAAEAARDAAAQELADVRSMVMAMQGAHLSEALPVLPRLDIAARYLLAAEDSASGGDWFDAVVRPSGAVALVVGDVVGHGTAASATMGQLRAVVHERLTSSADLAGVLADVDRFARTSFASRAATVCIVELDPRTGQGSTRLQDTRPRSSSTTTPDTCRLLEAARWPPTDRPRSCRSGWTRPTGSSSSTPTASSSARGRPRAPAPWSWPPPSTTLHEDAGRCTEARAGSPSGCAGTPSS